MSETTEMPGDFARDLQRRFGLWNSFEPIACWLVRSDKPVRVNVWRLRPADNGHVADYADLVEEKASAGTFYLFSRRPRLVELADGYGKFTQWVVARRTR